MGSFGADLAKVGGQLVKEAAPTAEKEVGNDIGKAAQIYYHMRATKTIFEDKAKTDPVVHQFWHGLYNGVYRQAEDAARTDLTKKAVAAGSRMETAEITKQAKAKASEIAFGQNRNRIQGYLKYVEKAHGKNTADVMSDNLNILFREAPGDDGLSKFDRDMRGPKDLSGNYKESSFKTPPSKYRDSHWLEKASRIHRSLLAWKAAIPHAATQLNILHEAGLVNYARTLNATFNPSSKEGAEQMVLASNQASELWLNGYRERENFENGKISKYMPRSVGEFLHRNMFNPGMSRLRYQTVLMSAHSGRFEAEAATDQLRAISDLYAKKGKSLPKDITNKATSRLRQLGLDPQKIISQGFKLNPEDIDKVYFNNIDQKAFSSSSEHRSAFGQRHPLTRAMSAFHSAVATQANFFQRSFTDAIKRGDYVGVSRQIGMLAIAFPIVGAVISETEDLLNGRSKHPIDNLSRKIEDTPGGAIFDGVLGRKNPYNAASMTMNTIQMLSHVAGFGVVTGYARAAGRTHLAGQILGPDANMGIQGVEDIAKALSTDSNHPHAWEAFARDALADLIPFEGNKIAHEVLPTTKDANEDRYHRYKRNKTKKSSWNPLAYINQFDK